MKKKYTLGALILALSLSARPARADFWGADIPILLEILANAVKQLMQLQQALNTARSQLEFIRQINRGINDSISLIRVVYPNFNPTLYQEWNRIQGAVAGVTNVYGVVPESRDKQVQGDADKSVAEAIVMNNEIAKYTKQMADLSEQLKSQSQVASPGRAQQLTAASLAALIQLTTQSVKAQAAGVKLQAQALAIGNRKEKEETRTMLDTSSNLSASMKELKPEFTVPRF